MTRQQKDAQDAYGRYQIGPVTDTEIAHILRDVEKPSCKCPHEPMSAATITAILVLGTILGAAAAIAVMSWF